MAFVQGGELRLPVLPNAAWFFFASPPNYLSLRDDLPAQGGLAATFQSPSWPAGVSLLGIPALPFLFLPPAVKLLRRLGRRTVSQDSASLEFDSSWSDSQKDLGLSAQDPTAWHEYTLEWRAERTTFWVDGEVVLETEVSPTGSLGLVLWVDNQYAALPPDGRARYGTLPNPEAAWIDIEEFWISIP
jgi:hypothetical protein